VGTPKGSSLSGVEGDRSGLSTFSAWRVIASMMGSDAAAVAGFSAAR
jgi:hypothetical protein